MPPDRPPNPNPDDRANPNADRAVAEMLLNPYARGLFPMADPGGDIFLYDPDPRGVIPLADGGIRISRSLRQRVNSGRFTITTNRAFSHVIRACAEPRPAPAGGNDAHEGGEDGSWIDDRIIAMYEALHRTGNAHSIEAWLMPDDSRPGEPAVPARGEPVLVGGLYGVHLRGLFAGESMFSRPSLGGTDASKVCLVHLWHHLRERGFTLLDTQFTTPHLERLGAIEISRAEYKAKLHNALQIETDWHSFRATVP